MKTLLLSTIVFLVAATAVFAGVQNGESANGAPHGDVTMNSKGGCHGDYKVTFTDDAGTSKEVAGTPTMGGDPGEVDETPWVTTPGGGTYRIHNGRFWKKDKNGNPVQCGPPSSDDAGDAIMGPGTDNEGVGSLPCYFSADNEAVGTLPYMLFHVPVPRPTDRPYGDRPPKLEKNPLPAF